MCAEPLARGVLAPLPRQTPSITPEQLFHANLAVIDEATRYVAGHYRLTPQEREELVSDVRLRLMENDYAVLRRFEYRSNLKTFLITVISRHYLDQRDKERGKWRASTEAKRLGPVAVKLERMVARDGISVDEAIEILKTNHQVPHSRDELYDMLQKLPVKQGRRLVGEQALETVEAGTRSDDGLMAQERAMARERVREAIEQAVAGLQAQDALIFTLHYVDFQTVADIARQLHLDQKPLYRRLAKIRLAVRQRLEALGITSTEALGELPDGPEDPE